MLTKHNSSQGSCAPNPSPCPHSFHLRPLHNTCWPISDTPLSFCPIEAGTFKTGNTFPEFNRDGQYFTPAFVLGVDRHYNEQNQSFELDAFRKRVEKAECSSSQLYFPQPGKASSYCSNCKSTFQDYIAHIHTQEHLNSLSASKATLFIRQLSNTRVAPKKKHIRKDKRKCPEKEKVVYEGSTLASKKLTQQEEDPAQVDLQKGNRWNKPLCQLSVRKLSLRNYQSK